MHKSCVCMPALSIFCLVDTPPYIHVCPVISNLSAYYVYVLILTEAADICIFEILLDFDDSFDIYISLLCSPWLPRHLYLSAARFILWAFFPRVFIYAWTLCSHFPHHELNCVFRIGPNVYRLLTTKKQSLTGLLAYYIYILLFEVLLGELWWFLYIYN